VVQIFKRQIERGGPITVTHPEMKRFFMTIPEAVHLVMQAGGMGTGGELFVLNMGEQIRIVDLLEDLVKLSGFEPGEIPIAYTGVRPGEKMQEALWEDDAIVERTAHPDVLKVTEVEISSSSNLADAVRALEAAAAREDRLEIEALLVQCIPTFAPMSSLVGSFHTDTPA
jgi:FlaA1/EpsC-like NDP-sugar epimerase